LEFQILNAPFPGNSRVNPPPPLEIPRLIHPFPWKFQGSSTGGVLIIIGIAQFMVGRTTLFTPVDINLEQVVDFLNFYACRTAEYIHLVFMLHEVRIKNQTMFINFIWFHNNFNRL
jgi:hypothetical protein